MSSGDKQKMASDKQMIAKIKQKQDEKIADALAPESMQEEKSAPAAASLSTAPVEESKKPSGSDNKMSGSGAAAAGSSSSSASGTTAAKRETRSIGELYQWKAADDVLKQFDVRFLQADFEALKKRVHEGAAKCEVTLDDVLAMKANVMNQREADKLAHIAQKQQELRDAAESALGTLLARAQVDKKQREARELKRKLAADRKQSAK